MGSRTKQDHAHERALVGRKVKKFFQGFGFFEGKIVSYDSFRGLFKVRYEDGDREELEPHEVKEILDDCAEKGSSKVRAIHRKREQNSAVEPDSAIGRCKDDFEKNPACKRQRRNLEGREETFDESRKNVGYKTTERLSMRTSRGSEGKTSTETRKPEEQECSQLSRSTRSCKRKRQCDIEKSVEGTLSPKLKKTSELAVHKKNLGNHQKLLRSSTKEESGSESQKLEESSFEDDYLASESSVEVPSDGNLDQVQETRFDHSKLPPLEPLPSSSGDLLVPHESVLDFLAVYSFLRSFSRALFLSPFCLEDFWRSLCCETANSLTDSLHVSLLQALRRHLERLAKEGSEVAINCLRQPDWNFLDAITWPSHLMGFLVTHDFRNVRGEKFPCLDREYYKVPVKTKLAILNFLCDHVMDTEEIRAELDMREALCTNNNGQKDGSSFDLELHQDPDDNSQITQGPKGTARDSLGGEEIESHEAESQDLNIDECVLCGMDGNLICCDGCPAAYHGRCVGISKSALPPGDWYCPECTVERLGGKHSKRVEGLRGGDVLGIDPYGRTFMATCGYLLVTESRAESITGFNYYNDRDLPTILEWLENLKPFCDSIKKAILQRWNIINQTDSTELQVDAEAALRQTPSRLSNLLVQKSPALAVAGVPCAVGNVQETKNTMVGSVACETDLVSEQILGACEGEPEVRVIKSGIGLGALETDGRTPERRPGSSSDLILNRDSCSLDVEQDQSKGNYEGRCSWIGVSHFQHDPQFHNPDIYINHYILGDTAATAAANLAMETAGHDCPGESRGLKKKTRATTITEQLKAFYKAPVQFYWPSSKKKSMEIPKERCGWCFSCSNPIMKRGCLLNQAAANLAAGATGVLGGIRPTKAGSGHLPAVAGYLLHIEDNLHSLLLGPWENINFRTRWRKQVKQAAGVHDLKCSLLQLESCLRSVVLSGNWFKSQEDAPPSTFGGASAVTASKPLPQKGAHRKSQHRVGRIAGSSLSKTEVSTWVQSWKRGKIAEKTFHWRVLPLVIARQAGRQGGLKKIQGLIYTEGSDVPIRSKHCAWCARVEAASTISQLALQVRCLDACIRWGDLSSNVSFLPSVERCEDTVAFEKATLYSKEWKGDVPIYLVGSAISTNENTEQKSCITPSLSRGLKPIKHTDAVKQVWLTETQMPLSLLRDFEERLRLLQQKNMPGVAVPQKCFIKAQKASKKDVFEKLWLRAGLSCPQDEFSSWTCKVCNLEALASMDECQICQAPFHKGCRAVTDLYDGAEMKQTCYRCSKTISGNRSSDHKFCASFEASTKMLQENISGTERSHSRKQSSVSIVTKEGYMEWRPVPVKISDSSVALKDHHPQHYNLPMSMRPSAPKRILKKNSERHPSTDGVQWRKNRVEFKGFSEDKILLPGRVSLESSAGPRCFLCWKNYDAKLLYIGCEYCPLWFHGDALKVTVNNFAEVTGFKCHRCRKKGGPSCPYGKKETVKTRKPQRKRNSDCSEVIDAVNERKGGCETSAELKGYMFSQTSELEGCSSYDGKTVFPNSALSVPIENSSNNVMAGHKIQVATFGLPQVEVNTRFAITHSSGELYQPWEGREQMHETCESPDMMRSVQMPSSVECSTGSWNAEACPTGTLPSTELLSSEDELAERLPNVTVGFGDNHSESSHPSQFTNCHVQSQSSGSVIPLSDGLEACKEKGITSCRIVQCLGECADHQLTDSARASKDVKKTACSVCSVNKAPPDLQCLRCGFSVHLQCYDWVPKGLWTGYGWTCDACKG